MRTPESFEKAEICKYLDSINAWYFRPYMAGYGRSGVPDIIACIRGAFVGVEVKREGKKPTPRQLRVMSEVADSGGLALCGTAAVVIPALKEVFNR